MKNIDEIIKGCSSIIEAINKIKHYNRSKGQEKCKYIKSIKMKKYWKEKKKKELQKKQDEEYYNSLLPSEKYTSCTCWLGNPPCQYCTDTNYCEDCDIKTWDNICPKCGKEIGR
jgi:HSP90 family molecular chaperone